MQDQDPVGDRIGLFEVVRGEQHRASLVRLLAHGGPECLARRHVHAGGRLVEDDQIAVARGGEGEADALRLTSGELVHLAVGDLRDARAGEHIGGLVRLRVQIAGEPDQLGDRDLVHQATALQHGAHAPRDDGLARAGPEHPDRAVVGVLEAEQQVEGGRLAGPVGPEQGHRLARVQLE